MGKKLKKESKKIEDRVVERREKFAIVDEEARGIEEKRKLTIVSALFLLR